MSEYRDSPLSAARVEEVFADCLAAGEQSHPTITVQGIVHTAHFEMAALDRYKAEIGAMLAQLPTEFRLPQDGGGGGWSFLNACNDRDGHQWTGLHRTMEQLFLLGIGTGQADWCMPREMWEVLPGGMPYVVVTV